jgi:hypothetical protein
MASSNVEYPSYGFIVRRKLFQRPAVNRHDFGNSFRRRRHTLALARRTAR